MTCTGLGCDGFCTASNCPTKRPVEGAMEAYASSQSKKLDGVAQEAAEKIAEIPVSWSNNLADEFFKSQQTVRIYGDIRYQHTDKKIEMCDESKRYAAEIAANVSIVIQEKAAAIISKLIAERLSK